MKHSTFSMLSSDMVLWFLSWYNLYATRCLIIYSCTCMVLQIFIVPPSLRLNRLKASRMSILIYRRGCLPQVQFTGLLKTVKWSVMGPPITGIVYNICVHRCGYMLTLIRSWSLPSSAMTGSCEDTSLPPSFDTVLKSNACIQCTRTDSEIWRWSCGVHWDGGTFLHAELKFALSDRFGNGI